jgi:dihydrolipoamide dehydrogenase
MEMLPEILSTEDGKIRETIKTVLERENGVKIITGIKVKKVKKLGEKKEVIYEKGGNIDKITVDEVVAVIGRIPKTEGLGLEELGVKFDEKGIHVNQNMETNIRGIYAAGDVTGGIMLAHMASAEAECAARNAVGIPSRISYKAVPKCIYTQPEIASVGLTEEEARKAYDIKVGNFPFYANGKALIMNESVGFVKIISELKHGEILGAHIIGPQATSMISELVLAIQMEATHEEVASSIHPHPTLSEAVMEAAMSLGKGAIHLP